MGSNFYETGSKEELIKEILYYLKETPQIDKTVIRAICMKYDNNIV